MKEIPRLETERLILRSFCNSDAAEVMSLAGEHAIADTTTHIPCPYEAGMAEEWISKHKETFGACARSRKSFHPESSIRPRHAEDWDAT